MPKDDGNKLLYCVTDIREGELKLSAQTFVNVWEWPPVL